MVGDSISRGTNKGKTTVAVLRQSHLKEFGELLKILAEINKKLRFSKICKRLRINSKFKALGAAPELKKI